MRAQHNEGDRLQAGAAFSAVCASQPSISGRLRSMRMRSGCTDQQGQALLAIESQNDFMAFALQAAR